MQNANLYALFESRFPQDKSACAIETHDGLYYSWRDIERATAKMANLLASLALPPDARIAVQVEKSPEALILYLATLQAGYVYLPLNTAYRAAEIEYFIDDAEPAVVVCAPGNFGWVSKIAFQAGTKHVFTLGEAREGTLLERASHFPDSFATVHKQRRRHGGDPVHLGHHRPQQGRHAQPRATCLPTPWCCTITGAGKPATCCCMRCRCSMCTACSSPRTAPCSTAAR